MASSSVMGCLPALRSDIQACQWADHWADAYRHNRWEMLLQLEGRELR